MTRKSERRIRKGVQVFTIPPVQRLSSVYFTAKGKRFEINIEDIEFIHDKRKMYKDMVGLPLYCALARGANEVHLYPSPYVSINLTVEYEPMEVTSGASTSR